MVFSLKKRWRNYVFSKILQSNYVYDGRAGNEHIGMKTSSGIWITRFYATTFFPLFICDFDDEYWSTFFSCLVTHSDDILVFANYPKYTLPLRSKPSSCRKKSLITFHWTICSSTHFQSVATKYKIVKKWTEEIQRVTASISEGGIRTVSTGGVEWRTTGTWQFVINPDSERQSGVESLPPAYLCSHA